MATLVRTIFDQPDESEVHAQFDRVVAALEGKLPAAAAHLAAARDDLLAFTAVPRAFLDWSAGHSELHAAWYTLAMTGMRRGELLALRWRDIDLVAGTVAVRRSAGIVRTFGEGAEVLEGPTKTERPRVIDLDPATAGLLRAHRWERELLAQPQAADSALVFGDEEDRVRHPERFSRLWNQTLTRAIRDGIDVPPIRLHDLRHTHATVLLQAGEPVSTVSRRLGHASATITMSVYSHVLPGDQKRAASRFASLVEQA